MKSVCFLNIPKGKAGDEAHKREAVKCNW